MHAASREALTSLTQFLENLIDKSDDQIGLGATLGTELFDVVDLLDGQRALRVGLIDESHAPEQRASLVKDLFGGKLSAATEDVLRHAVSLTWSNSRDFRSGLVTAGRIALLRSAKEQGNAERVEEELFLLARLMEREVELEMLLADKSVSADRRRDLLAKVLYGKVTSTTEALALQAIGRGDNRPVEELDRLASQVAGLEDREIARVRSAAPLDDEQRSLLAQKLENIYGRKITVHAEVDSSLLGGAVVRVGHEVIDGSIAGHLRRLRRSLV